MRVVEDNTAINFASRTGNQSVVDFLIKNGADKTLMNRTGQTYDNVKPQEQIQPVSQKQWSGNTYREWDGKISSIPKIDFSALNKKPASFAAIEESKKLSPCSQIIG